MQLYAYTQLRKFVLHTANCKMSDNIGPHNDCLDPHRSRAAVSQADHIG